MEFVTILLSVLLGLVSPVGVVTDRLAERAIREQVASVEDLAVRIDNTPSYQVLQGKIDRVRIAGRGVYPIPGARIAVLEVETDAIGFNPRRALQGQLELTQPLQGAVRIELEREDINRFLQSPTILRQLDDLSLSFPGSAQTPERYEALAPQVEFLGENRVRLQVQFQGQQTGQVFQLAGEVKLAIEAGRRLQLLEPVLSLDGTELPPDLVDLLVMGINERLDLASLEDSGILARVLELEIAEQTLRLAAFVQVEPNLLTPDRSTAAPPAVSPAPAAPSSDPVSGN